MINPTLTNEELSKIKSDRVVRSALARESHYWFFSVYLGHYLTYQFAPFHHDMFEITEDKDVSFSTIVAFRGSGKSTIIGLSFPIWAVVGKLNKKFILIVSQTQAQAKLQLANIKKELEGNDLLKADIGPFEEFSDEWGANSIVISNYGARITAVSTEQSIRGIRHGQYRPDLIICDDVEDSNSVKTKEGRDRTYNWFNSEIIPVGDKDTKIVVVGNLLHEDSLIMRLKKLINAETLSGKFLAFPLVTQDGKITWIGKYPTQEDVEKLKKSVPSESAYLREYLLTIVPDEGQIVHLDWIQYYDELPTDQAVEFRYVATGIDLAISKDQYADYTAMVSARVYGYGDKMKIYILPNAVNERLEFPEATQKAKDLSKVLGQGKLFVEDVAYQRSFIQQLSQEGYPAEGFQVAGQDKRARLSLTTTMIQAGIILFPRKGAESLIQQLVGFGIEKHDDLSDAFVILTLKIQEGSTEEPKVTIISMGSSIFSGYGEGIWEPITRDKVF